MPTSMTHVRRLVAALLAIAVIGGTSPRPTAAQSTSPPAGPPAHWRTVSVNMEDVPYPHPVQFLERTLFGQRVRIAYMDVAPTATPNGRAVVLLHGGSYYGWYWKDTIAALAAAGFRVVVEDRLGWGRSSKPILPYSMNLHASNTHALLQHLGLQSAAVVGHSMGGQMGSRFAFLYPKVATHLVLVNAIGMTDSRKGEEWSEPTGSTGPQDLQQVYEASLKVERGRVVTWKPEFLEHVRIRYGMTLSGEWPRLALVRAMSGQAASIDTIVHDWPQMETKTLVVAGAEDGPNFPAIAKKAAQSFQNGELFLIPNAGHNPHLEVPEIFNRELIRFLRSDPIKPGTTAAAR